MQTNIINIGLGFLEGLALIVSPCILPILPIILSASLTGSKKRPIGIIIGFALTFALFTLFARQLTQYSGIASNTLRHLSYVILFVLGLIMISSYLTEKFNLATQRLTSVGAENSTINDPQGGLLSGILFGSLVAIIWTPCAGPILAAIVVQVVIQKTTLMSFLTLTAFGLGAVIPMFVIAIAGRNILTKFNFFKQYTTLIRKLLGLIIILSVIYLAFFAETLSATPSQIANSNSNSNSIHQSSLEQGLLYPYPAPPIEGIEAWINSEPLQLNQLKGKVVLIDFWTYSCINCIRTLPYLRSWYKAYHDKGLVIIGIHSPEFDFEKNLNNVKNAVIQDKINYPVALDNQFKTWQNFNNRYWPAEYLIDKNGNVVYVHFGEGADDIIENNIRYLLGLNMPTQTATSEPSTFSLQQTPETYLGYARAKNFFSNESIAKNQDTTYSFPAILPKNKWALQGQWRVMADRIIATQADAAIEINFYASKVYMVMGNATSQSVKLKVVLNGKIISAPKTKDVGDGLITVDKHSIYTIVDLAEPAHGILRVVATSPGLEIYTFTFG